jgi:hypothetical protein
MSVSFGNKDHWYSGDLNFILSGLFDSIRRLTTMFTGALSITNGRSNISIFATLRLSAGSEW